MPEKKMVSSVRIIQKNDVQPKVKSATEKNALTSPASEDDSKNGETSTLRLNSLSHQAPSYFSSMSDDPRNLRDLRGKPRRV